MPARKGTITSLRNRPHKANAPSSCASCRYTMHLGVSCLQGSRSQIRQKEFSVTRLGISLGEKSGSAGKYEAEGFPALGIARNRFFILLDNQTQPQRIDSSSFNVSSTDVNQQSGPAQPWCIGTIILKEPRAVRRLQLQLSRNGFLIPLARTGEEFLQVWMII